jgi:hypothetical protein
VILKYTLYQEKMPIVSGSATAQEEQREHGWIEMHA